MRKDDDFFFQQEMHGVTPIRSDKVARLVRSSSPSEAQLARRQAAEAQTDGEDREHLSMEYAEMLHPDEIVSYKKPGIQEGVFRKLRLGKYELQARLDLHRKTLKEARLEVQRFIRQCQQLDIRSVIIVHGRGERANPPALLKSYVTHWLPHFAEVQAFHSALRHHGGTGAVYVLLRKSAEAKADNRERHARRLK